MWVIVSIFAVLALVGLFIKKSQERQAAQDYAQRVIAEKEAKEAERQKEVFAKMEAEKARKDAEEKHRIEEEKRKKNEIKISVPSSVEKERLVYKYDLVSLDLYPEADEIAGSAREHNSFEFSLDVCSDKTTFILCGQPFGVLSSGRLAQMIFDFENRGDTVKAWLQKYDEDGGFAFLAFYQDEEKKYASRSSNTYKLTRYAANAIQENIAFSSPGDRLEIEEDDDDEEKLWVTDGLNRLGLLPKTAANKYLDEGAAAVFLSSVEYDEDRDKHVPIVKIYW